jgi:hypothetical protein
MVPDVSRFVQAGVQRGVAMIETITVFFGYSVPAFSSLMHLMAIVPEPR